MLEKYDHQFDYCKSISSDKSDPDTIYYHRELFCHSLDKRRIDLITISACNQMSSKREPRYDPEYLFPDKLKRCFNFENKRVFVLTSRVHPGETPASFVFNGFLEFILRKDDPRARLLRRNFVFKLIPMLNPDGVARGHYRTDQLGVNLNRVYLDPDFERHPSIYAAKSLIVFHHVNNRVSKEHDGLNFDKLFKLENDKKEGCETQTELLNETIPAQKDIEPKRASFYLEESSSSSSSSSSGSSPSSQQDSGTNGLSFKRSKSFAVNSNSPIKDYSKLNMNHSLDLKNVKTNYASTIEDKLKDIVIDMDNQIGNENSDEECEKQDLIYTLDNNTSINRSIYSPHLNEPKLTLINPLWSGIAFYMDLHGHAAKRGCFIYGNSIDNELHQIENVLFTKLISFNTQHFDFDGCNFSVKNMFMKDKREGLSKEGSGRVAMYKTLGLIHSYTLECCYASGRVMNSIAPATNTSPVNVQLRSFNNGAISPPLHTDLPPKFLAEHYADVGKAVAISALDIAELNPHSRVPNTSFGSLEAVRNWIKFFIKSKNGGGFTSQNNQSSNTLANNSQSSSNLVRKQANQRFLVRESQKTGKFIKSNNPKLTQKEKQTIALKSFIKSVNVPSKKSATPQLDSNSNLKASNSKRFSLGIEEDQAQLDRNETRLKKILSPTQVGYKSSNFSAFGGTDLKINNNDFSQSHSQFRSSIKKMKELEIPVNSRASIAAKIANNKIDRQASNDNEDQYDFTTKWYSNQETDLSLAKSSQNKSKIVNSRKLMPLNKATVISSPINNLNANIVLFNKINNDLASKNKNAFKNKNQKAIFNPKSLSRPKPETHKSTSEPTFLNVNLNQTNQELKELLLDQTDTISSVNDLNTNANVSKTEFNFLRKV